MTRQNRAGIRLPLHKAAATSKISMRAADECEARALATERPRPKGPGHCPHVRYRKSREPGLLRSGYANLAMHY